MFTLTDSTGEKVYRVRGSRFIAATVPLGRQEEIGQILGGVRARFPDATHICYAYRLGDVGERVTQFASDAGEPTGSAGKPILNVLRRADLVNVAVWVVRYYGGTKLGIPGLIDAYTQAVRLTLGDSSPVPWVAMTGIAVTLPYPLVDRVKVDVQGLGGEVRHAIYTGQVELQLHIPVHEAPGFLERLTEWGGGAIHVTGDED
ncbi:MAG: YigZ family protein [Candidatus Marinimicrobia bacterium]|nr:YigZ family protein [Candidatus Neomarinimicrobiota bacterium]